MFAPVGVQLLDDRLSVIVAVPVFLTYTVRAVLAPADSDPQFMELRLVVQALSE